MLHHSLLLHSLYADLILDDEQQQQQQQGDDEQSDEYLFTNEVKRMVNLTKQINLMFTKYYMSRSVNLDINRT
ncbi:hypothetical protein LH51_08230 [Nitrincola sp. A-D6]|nr:hypothetical protein LH51_08230 [Nitrincola sp. A-D6]